MTEPPPAPQEEFFKRPRRPLEPRRRPDARERLAAPPAGSGYRLLKLASIAAISALLVLGLLALSMERRAVKWIEIAPKDGAFVALFPGTPDVFAKRETTAAGPIEVHYHVLGNQFTGRFYSIAWVDHPMEAFTGRNGDQILDDALEAAVRSSGGRKTGSRAIKLGAHPGREFTIQLVSGTDRNPVDVVLTNRIYLVRWRLFFLVHGTGTSWAGSGEDMTTFFDSFKPG